MSPDETNIVDLDRLRVDAAALDAGAVPAPGAPELDLPAAPDPAAELAAVISVCVGILAPVFPSLPAIYTEQTVHAVAAATAPVLEKYGVEMGGLFGRWQEEIKCAIVVVPVALATKAAIENDLAARKIEPAKADKKPAPLSPGNSVGNSPPIVRAPGEPDDPAVIRSVV
jgi:hypothetical protein